MYRSFLVLFAVGCAESALPPEEADALAEFRFDPAACDLVVPDDAPDVQAGVDAAADGDTVCVEAGTWFGPVDLTGRQLTLLGDGARRTILDAEGRGTAVVVVDAEVELGGFTITGGDGRAASGPGGIDVANVVDTTSLVLHDAIVTRNRGSGGGGIAVYHADVEAWNVEISRNRAVGGGGGIYVSEAGFRGDRISLTRNRAGGGGGGGWAGRGGIGLTRSEVLANVDDSTTGGGGFYLFTGGGPFYATVIAGNVTGGDGGGIHATGYSGPLVENVVLAGNTAARGGAVNVGYVADMEIRNTAIVRNRATVEAGAIFFDYMAATAEVAYTDFWNNGDPVEGEGYVGVDGNISVPPRFVDFASGRPLSWDFSLQDDSELIDAGDPALLDADGTRSDIGAYGGPYAM